MLDQRTYTFYNEKKKMNVNKHNIKIDIFPLAFLALIANVRWTKISLEIWVDDKFSLCLTKFTSGLAMQFSYRFKAFLWVQTSLFSLQIECLYPRKMTLNTADRDKNSCRFLDLNGSLWQGKIEIKIYDKRGDFSFPVVYSPHLTSKSLWILSNVYIY